MWIVNHLLNLTTHQIIQVFIPLKNEIIYVHTTVVIRLKQVVTSKILCSEIKKGIF